MANTKSAQKAARVRERRALVNRRVTSALRTHVKNAREALGKSDVAAAQKSTRLAVAKLDKAGARGYIHHNKASRLKSRLVRRLNGMMARAAGPSKRGKARD